MLKNIEQTLSTLISFSGTGESLLVCVDCRNCHHTYCGDDLLCYKNHIVGRAKRYICYLRSLTVNKYC